MRGVAREVRTILLGMLLFSQDPFQDLQRFVEQI
jgi:hypothetical protein